MNTGTARVDWHESDDVGRWAAGAADDIANALADALARKDRARLLLSGGTTPAPVYARLANADLDWTRVDVGLVDERWLPPDDAHSNTRLLREHLLRERAAAAHFEPFAHAGDTLDDAVQAANLDARQAADIVVLGMGGDGHTASLFPQAPQLDKGLDPAYAEPLLHTSPVTAPHERISMTLEAVAATPAVFLAIQGAEKKAVYEAAAAQASKTYPLSFVLNHKKVTCHVYYAN